MKLPKKEIRRNRLKKHFLYWCHPPYFHSDLRKWQDYEKEKYIDTFLNVQSHGYKNLSDLDKENITPLVQGQVYKEIFLNSILMEIFDWDSRGWGWIHPINHTLNDNMDRLTRLALLRIKRRLSGKHGMDKDKNILGFGNRLEFYLSHPISKLPAFNSEFNTILSRFKEYFKV